MQDAVGSCTLDMAFDWLAKMAASRYSLPGCVILENPKGLTSCVNSGTGEFTLLSIYRDLKHLGYTSIAHRTIHCASFGQPTSRERVLVVAGIDVDARQVLLSQVRNNGLRLFSAIIVDSQYYICNFCFVRIHISMQARIRDIQI